MKNFKRPNRRIKNKFFDKDDTEKVPFAKREEKRNYINKKRTLGTFNKGKKQLFPHSKEDIRLNRYIANSGVCSRREADQLIASGLVTVNGKIVSELGTKVSKKDSVKVQNKLVNPEKNVYLLLNKPKDFITTSKDTHQRKTVMQLVERACEQRIYPVGRLDRMTTGVLLFTNDGDLAKKLTHPKHKVKKIYHVTLNKPLVKKDMETISQGVELEDGFTPVDAIAYPNKDLRNEVGIEIHSGKNRIIRRIFEHFGYKVVKLDRVFFAGLTKKNIPRGKWRILSEQEIIFLKRQSN